MSKMVSLKLTDEELDLLDALVVRNNLDSRSAALRFGLTVALGRAGLGHSAARAKEERQSTCRRRRSRPVIDRHERNQAG